MNTPTLLALIFVSITGDVRFRVREAASAWLGQHQELAAGACWAGEQQGCEETRQRCKPLVDRWYSRHADELAEALRPGWGWPWVSYTVLEYGAVDYYLGQARGKGAVDSAPEWAVWREATRLLVRDLTAARQPAGEMLGRLADAHRQWCRENNYPVPD